MVAPTVCNALQPLLNFVILQGITSENGGVELEGGEINGYGRFFVRVQPKLRIERLNHDGRE